MARIINGWVEVEDRGFWRKDNKILYASVKGSIIEGFFNGNHWNFMPLYAFNSYKNAGIALINLITGKISSYDVMVFGETGENL